jgi:DNA-binding beta-propeller fold protein YncE
MRGAVRRLLVVGLAVGTAGLAGSPVAASGEGVSSVSEVSSTRRLEEDRELGILPGTEAASELESGVASQPGAQVDRGYAKPAARKSPEPALAVGKPKKPEAAQSSKSDSGPTLSSSLGSGLLVSPFQPSVEGGQAGVQGPAKSMSPAAVKTREESRTKFEHLGATRAAQVAREVFPAAIERPAGGPPSLPTGQRVVGYVSPNVARLALPGGKRAVVESTQPMALETSSRQLEPVDLSLTEADGMFVSVRPVVGVLIPQRLSDGVELPETGVSLTPVDAQGAPVGGSEGVVDGASVFYSNTQLDTDTSVKPTTEGFEADTVLRSVESPAQLRFRVGVPEGASLVQTSDEDGPVRVVDEGRTVAVISPSSAMDATGANVPVSMSVSGDLLVLTVSADGGKYQYPISVDPEVRTAKDTTIGPSECLKSGEAERASSNWCLHSTQESKFSHNWQTHAVEMWNSGGSISAGEYIAATYHTQGKSRIYEAEAWTAGNVPNGVAKLELARERSSEEGSLEVPAVELANHAGWNTGAPGTKVCSNSECSTSGGSAGNLFAFKLEANEATSETYGVEGTILDPKVYIAQESAPEATFNESAATIDSGRTNALYGSGAWLGPSTGAFEVKAHDPGIGVSWAQVVVGSFRQKEPIYEEGKCLGVQCKEEYAASFTYNASMSEGEPTIEWWAEDETGLFTKVTKKIKVDATPPHSLEVSGWPKTREISATPHTLTLEATDGVTGTPSSGVKSISVSVDGGAESPVSIVPCTPGPCTVSGKWTLDAESLSEGVHRLVETATDNAGNIASKEFTFDVRHGSPVAVGPGNVDPTTGQFKLSATDVSLAGAGGVSRVYQSRDLMAGAGGPLGPQWAISMGGGEGLTVLPTGSVVLAGSAGGTTTFTRNSKGEFESPLGDNNLKVEAKEKEKGKGITEYLLIDTSAGTTTTFTQPTGTELTTPVYANQFGGEGAQLHAPESDAVDSSGNVWVADYQDDRIEKFSPAGVLLASYDSYGPYQNQLIGPWGIAVNQSTGDVYVTDQGNNRVDELNEKGEFVRTFGWDVNDGGADQFEVCTTYCKPGIAGSGNGQVDVEAGIAVDSSGNVWVADYGNNRIEEFNEKGEYLQKFGTEGKGEVQFKGPLNIAFSGGNLYVTDYGNDRIEELSTAGKYLSQFGKEGTGSGEFKSPRGIAAEPRTGNLYVTDAGNDRVQEFSPAGKFIAKFGSPGSGAGQFSEPTGVAVGVSGIVYVTDYNNNRVQEWTRPSWLPSLAEGSLKSGTTAYAYEAVEEEGETVIEPTEALAPTPAGVSCGTKLAELKELKSKGCRALTFKYATATTASGESQSEWGAYKGHLEKVYFTAYNPAAGSEKMEEKAVAEYSYDKQGRLRAEWDPRISPALKTTYGYDVEGHVTALTPPGQESWAFTYGTISGDTNTGRLLKVVRAPASATLWKGELPKNTEAPKLSGSPVVGVPMGVSNGTWSNNPVGYGYQWEDCNSSGLDCTSILGATNANYTVASSDVGHTLVAQVTATNGGGSVSVSTAASAIITTTAGAYIQAVDSGNSLNAVSCVPGTTDCVVSDSAGKALYATSVSTTSSATWKTWSGPSGESPSQAVDCPTSSLCLLVDGHESGAGERGGGDLYYATSLGGSWTEAYSPVYGVDAVSCASSSFCVDGQDGAGFFRYSTKPASTSWTLEQQGADGEPSMKGVFCLSSSFCAIADGAGKVHVANSTSQIESSSWTETDVDGTSALNGIGCTSTTSCVAVDGAGNVLSLTIASKGEATASKHNIDGTSSLTAVTCTGSSTCVTVDNAGNVFVSKNSGETWTKQYTLSDKLTSVSCASTTLCATVDTTGNVAAFNPAGGTKTEGEHHSPGPGSTIEYRVPTSGTGLPNVSASEVAKWGQKDDPTEGVAIFPPDEPQGWPAKDYKRATIHYWDEEGRTVNTEVPSGGIATSEYNEANEVTRTLSADNRAAALKETGKTAEASEKLDTKSTYSAGGTELLETIGPEHEIKRAAGGEVQARDHVKYYYDEGAKEVEEKTHESYDLLTKKEDFGETAGKEKFDERTTKTSYSGQENLGWKLRKPTSVTTDPSGLNLTSTTKYEKATGNVEETQTPAAAGKDAKVPLSYSLKFGTAGEGSGQFEGPEHDALDSHGDIWVADYGNNRIQEFSASGTFMLAVGWGVKDGKAEAETCTTECKAGISGSGNGQLDGPVGLAINQTSGDIYVGDYANNRIEEFSSTGTWLATIGSKGTAGGDFSSPQGITIDSSGDVWVADYGNNRIQELSSSGTFMLAIGWGVKDGKAEAETCTSSCEAGISGSGNGQMANPAALTFSGGNLYVADYSNNRIDEFSTAGAYVSQFGSKGTATGEFEGPHDMATEAASGDLYVVDKGNNRVQKFSAAGAFISTFGTDGSGNGQLEHPDGMTTTSSGSVYVNDSLADSIEEWVPAIAGNEAAHDVKTIYYSVAANSEYKGCGEHAEWANLPCETKPVAQPGTSGLPELPITTVTYNLWDEVEKTEEAFGSTKRTKAQTYDPAGRALTSEETSTVDTALPKVTNEYSTETGALVKQSTTVGEKTKAITSEYNTLGQLISYTDADGAITTYEYEPEEDARLTKMSYTIEKEGFSQTYGYNTITGAMQELTDASTGTDPAAGKFTATYDVEGKMLTAGYPNGMTETYTYNSLGQATGLVYEKTVDCAKTCPETWFSDSVTASIHGETLAQTSTLAKDSYAYDKAGRLTETQETPTGKDCATRLYGYDEESNRTTLTKRESSSETCATEGGNTEWHTYDTANRLTDAGVAYEALGNTTALPAPDAGGNELTSSYYVDGQVASQTQSEKTIDYHYDPAGRTEETEAIVKGKPEATVIDHYAGSGEALTWSSEGAEKWSRNIPGIDGALDAIQTNAGTPVLQLHNLAGDIVATVNDSEAETKLATTYNSTEFGVPQPGTTPPKYAWLGANGLATELSSGTATKGGASYVPQVARNLQTAPVVPPGAFPNGTGTGSQYTSEIPGWYISLSNAESAATVLEYAAKLEAERKQAEKEALERQHYREEESTPTEGGAEEAGSICEVADLTGQEAEGCGGSLVSESTLGTSGNGATDARVYSWETWVKPATATAWGYVLTVLGTPLGEHSLEFSTVPGWFAKVAEAATRVQLIKTGGDLIVAGGLPGCEAVHIQVFGTWKYGFTVDVSAYLGG